MLQAIRSTVQKVKGSWGRPEQPAQGIRPAAEPEQVLAQYLQNTPDGSRGLNLGCGGMTFKGWLNIDADQPHHVDILWDLRNKLPPCISNNSFDYVYSEHFMEHIDRKSALELMRDCFRVLKKGGHIRIAMPDLDQVIKVYLEDKKYPEVHSEFKDFYGELFYTRGELHNIAMRAWGHTYLYNYEDLSLLLKAAGFSQVHRVGLNRSDVPFLANRESRPAEQSSLIAEGLKS